MTLVARASAFSADRRHVLAVLAHDRSPEATRAAGFLERKLVGAVPRVSGPAASTGDRSVLLRGHACEAAPCRRLGRPGRVRSRCSRVVINRGIHLVSRFRARPAQPKGTRSQEPRRRLGFCLAQGLAGLPFREAVHCGRRRRWLVMQQRG